MRIYESATIKDEPITGFQSPASEFAQKPLSFDEKFGIGNPALKLIRSDSDFPQFEIFKGDQLLVDISRSPVPNSLIVTILDDEVRLFKASNNNQIVGYVCGVVKAIIRSTY